MADTQRAIIEAAEQRGYALAGAPVAAHPEVIRALLAERDALRQALKTIKEWPVTSPLNMDAHNMQVVAQAALAKDREDEIDMEVVAEQLQDPPRSATHYAISRHKDVHFYRHYANKWQVWKQDGKFSWQETKISPKTLKPLPLLSTSTDV